MKKCAKCGIEKGANEFYKNPRLKSGLSSSCKACISIASKIKYVSIHGEKKPRKWTKEYRIRAIYEYNRRPDQIPKMNARYALRYAVITGKLEKKPCEVCSEPKSEGHHEDYSKPLEVVWLCRPHHAGLHKELRKAKPHPH